MTKSINLHYFPTIGILIFIVLSCYASLHYAGGSQIDLNAVGFDWVYNYWCDLMSPNTWNGEVNPASLYAIAGVFILGVSIAYFFYLFPLYFQVKPPWNQVIQVSGILAMCFAVFVFTAWHDTMILGAGTFGLIALSGVGVALIQYQEKIHIILGVVCVILIKINTVLYFVLLPIGIGIVDYLPLLQKVTLVLVLIWVVRLNLAFK